MYLRSSSLSLDDATRDLELSMPIPTVPSPRSDVPYLQQNIVYEILII